MHANDRMEVPKQLRKDWDELVSPGTSLALPNRPSPQQQAKPQRTSSQSNPSRKAGGEERQGSDSIEILGTIRETVDSVVYEAWDHAAKRHVAIHVLRDEVKDNPKVVEDFWRRSCSQAKADHTNIVSVYSIEQTTGRVVAEFCKPAFDQQLPKNGLPENEVRRLLRDALSGLEYLHRQGKIHGALSPVAIMLSDMGTYKLDRLSGRQVGEELQLVRGNEKYLAPEILDESRFGPVGEAADLYALGMIALEALAGRKFLSCFADCGLDLQTGGEIWLRWQAASEERVAELSTVLPKTDPQLAQTIDQLLCKQVAARPASATKALQLLNSQLPEVASTTAHGNPPVTSLSGSNFGMQVAPLNPAQSEPQVMGAVAAASVQSRRAPASWQERLDGLFAEENANKVAGAILLVVTFIAGLAFIDPKPAAESTGPAIDFSVVEEPKIELGPAEPEPPEAESEIVEVPVERPKPVPPPPQPTTGRLVVRVEPSDAWLEVNGQRKLAGESIVLPFGEHVVKAGKWDRVRETRRIRVERGRSQVIKLNLLERAAAPRYEPVLELTYPGADQADEIVRKLVGELWTEPKRTLELSRIKRLARKQSSDSKLRDARVLHAIAAQTSVQAADLEEALEWYTLAADHSPTPYSWTDKGVIKTMLMLNQTNASLRWCKEFVRDAADFAEQYPRSQRAKLFLIDTAVFAGRAVGLVEILTGQRDATAMVVTDLRSYLAPTSSAADEFEFARQQILQRYRESKTGPRVDAPLLVRGYLGESLAEERRALKNSVGRRSSNGSSQTRVSVPENGRIQHDFPRQMSGRENFGNNSGISDRS